MHTIYFIITYTNTHAHTYTRTHAHTHTPQILKNNCCMLLLLPLKVNTTEIFLYKAITSDSFSMSDV